jgi:hypothetical protein
MRTELIRRVTTDITPGERFSDRPVCRFGLPHTLYSGTHSCLPCGPDIRSGLLSAP